MLNKNQVSDRTVLQKVSQKMGRLGSSQSRVHVAVRNGDVTLSGKLQYENQRRPIIKAASAVAGVRRVVDQCVVESRRRDA